MAAIVFDLDGTLIDVSSRHYAVYRQVTEELRGAPLPEHDYWAMKRRRAALADVVRASGMSDDAEFARRFERAIEEAAVLVRDTVIPGAVGALEALSDRPLYLVSLRQHPDRATAQLESLQLAAFFERTAFGRPDGDVAVFKAELVRRIVPGPVGAVVGDTEVDIALARHLGATAVAVTTGLRNRDYLVECRPDLILATVAELPGRLDRGLRELDHPDDVDADGG